MAAAWDQGADDMAKEDAEDTPVVGGDVMGIFGGSDASTAPPSSMLGSTATVGESGGTGVATEDPIAAAWDQGADDIEKEDTDASLKALMPNEMR